MNIRILVQNKSDDPLMGKATPGDGVIEITEVEARQAVRGLHMLKVLAASLVLTVAGVFGLWMLHVGPFNEVAKRSHASRVEASRRFSGPAAAPQASLPTNAPPASQATEPVAKTQSPQ